MHASALLGAAAAAALCGTVAAIPAQDAALQPRDGANDNDLGLAPWVTVDNEGQPATTYSPTVTGTAEAENTPPHEIGASVFTSAFYGKLTTRTGLPPNPEPTDSKKSDAGYFSRCYNPDGQYSPFCRPTHNSTIYIDRTYYITWDPDYYKNSRNAANTTYMVSLRIDYLNTTSKEYVKLEHRDKMYPAKWGYMPYHFDSFHLAKHRSNNVTFTLYGHTANNSVAIDKQSASLPVVITSFPLDKNPDTVVPKGKNLVIALPVVFGTIVLLVIGLCIWNRQTRRIQLGNIMSRSRGYTGRQHRRLFNRGRKDNGIQLDATPLTPPPIDYRDIPERPRRDSDALGSLTGSPVRGTFEEQGTTGGRNAFRDEVNRQDRERRDDMF